MNSTIFTHFNSTGLSGTQFSTLKRALLKDPEGPEKITTLKYGATFYCCHTALGTYCCDVFVNILLLT
jgi:hypothetical protein